MLTRRKTPIDFPAIVPGPWRGEILARCQREFRAGCPPRIALPIGHHHAGRRLEVVSCANSNSHPESRRAYEVHPGRECKLSPC
jgi:hypothetical protein